MASALIAIATLPMLSLTVSHQCHVQSGVRIPSLDIILLDFDAIAGEFVGLRKRPRSGIGRELDALANGTVLARANGSSPGAPTVPEASEDWLCFDRVKSDIAVGRSRHPMEGDG